MQIVVVSRKPTSMPNSVARVAWMTSFCTSPYSDTEISWRRSSWRRLISGSCSASWVSAARRRPLSRGSPAATTVSRVGGANCRVRRQRTVGSAAVWPPIAQPVADLDPGQAPEPPDLARRAPRRPAAAPPWPKTRIAVTLAPAPARPSPAHPLPNSHRAGEHPDVGDLLAGRAALDLEHRAATGPPGPARPRGQQFADARGQRLRARAGDGGAEEHRVHQRPPGLLGQRSARSRG